MLPDEGMAIEICKYMGWSWTDYESAPPWLVDGVIIRMSEEAKAQKSKEYGGK